MTGLHVAVWKKCITTNWHSMPNVQLMYTIGPAMPCAWLCLSVCSEGGG